MRRSDIDDAPPIALAHLRDDGADGVKVRRQIDGNNGIPAVDWETLDRRRMLDAGIVDENIDLAELARSRLQSFGRFLPASTSRQD